MIKQDIIHNVIERTGLPRNKAEAAVDTVFESLKKALAGGDRIELRGFGVFNVRPRKTGIGRNPRTGAEVTIAPGKAVRFKPGKELHLADASAVVAPEPEAEAEPSPLKLLAFRHIFRHFDPAPVSRWQASLSIFLFFVTLFTTTSTGALYMWNFRHGVPAFASVADFIPFEWIFAHPRELVGGWSFSLTLLSILLAHEFGHWILCARHRIMASWPYLLPAPSLSGTAGAVIRIRYGIPSRDALMDVGIAGPVAGFLVALPATVLGLLLSKSATGPIQPILIRLNAPLAMQIVYAPLRMLVPTSSPITDLIWHPVLIAAWVGLFITSLNLIPAGQLDGGHILYSISRRWHRRVTIAVPIVLLVAGITLWIGWLLWGVILLIPAMRHPYVPPTPELSPSRQRFGWIGLVMLALTFLPAPFVDAGLLGYLR